MVAQQKKVRNAEGTARWAARVGIWLLAAVGAACGNGSQERNGPEPSGAGGMAGGTAGTNPGGNAGVGGDPGAGGGPSGGAEGESGGAAGAAGVGSGGGAGAGAAGAGAAGAGAAGAGGMGGTPGDVDCSTDPCDAGELCVRDAGDCSVTTGRCRSMTPESCAAGKVCGCDGAIHDNACAAYAAGTKPQNLAACTRPDGVVPCRDKFCDAATEWCQTTDNSLCPMAACYRGCPGGYTVYSSLCVPQQPMCAPTMFGCACVEGNDGINIVCFTGCGVG